MHGFGQPRLFIAVTPGPPCTVMASPACVSLIHQDLHARSWPTLLICCCYTRTFLHGFGQPCLCVAVTPGPSCTVLASPAYLSLLHQDLHARLWPALLVCRCTPGPSCTVLASPAYLTLLHQDLHARLWPALLVCRCYTSRRISPGNTARKSHQQQRIVLEKNTTDRAALTCTPATAPQAPSTCRCSTSMRGSWWSSRRTGCTRTDRPAWHGTLGSGSTPPSPPFRPCTATEMRIACLNKYPQAVRLVHDSGLW
jgi:sulfur transfer complex TusBCD TusB component (DsrH family)